MTRLRVHAEGPTEKNFVDRVLAPHLYGFGYTDVSARLIGRQRLQANRGGIRSWHETRSGIINHLREDAGLIVTTMVDYYGMPPNGLRSWPGRTEAIRLTFSEKAPSIETAMHADVVNLMGDGFNRFRFVPCVVMHEFEAMLFSDCQKFSQAIGHPELAGSLQEIRNAFATPEEIDDSSEHAPAKRILRLVPDYQKSVDGILAALAIGLAAIREECPRFHQWLGRLEQLAAATQ